MALNLLPGKKKAAAPVLSESDLSAQNVKLLHTLQVVFLSMGMKLKLILPAAEAFVGHSLTPEALILEISRQQSDSNMQRLLGSVNKIIKAACDDQVSLDDFDYVLLTESAVIKELAKDEDRRVTTSIDSGQDRER